MLGLGWASQSASWLVDAYVESRLLISNVCSYEQYWNIPRNVLRDVRVANQYAFTRHVTYTLNLSSLTVLQISNGRILIFTNGQGFRNENADKNQLFSKQRFQNTRVVWFWGYKLRSTQILCRTCTNVFFLTTISYGVIPWR